jgi:hypothetical protein
MADGTYDPRYDSMPGDELGPDPTPEELAAVQALLDEANGLGGRADIIAQKYGKPKPPKATEKTEKLLKAHRPTRVHDHLDPETAAKLRLMADKERYRHG